MTVKKNLFDSLLAIQSSGWLKPVLRGPAGFLFQGKALKFNIQSDISIGLATLHFR
jgi:hypothetical protein